MMNGADPVAHFRKPFFHPRLIFVKTEGDTRIGNENSIDSPGAQEIANVKLWIIKVGFTGIGGIADQKKSHG
jgi:hypothetical protein